jgi:hypothetical protein
MDGFWEVIRRASCVCRQVLTVQDSESPFATWHSKQRDEVEGTPGFAGNVSVALGLALSPGSGQNRRADETRFQFETQAARFLTVEV